MPLHVTAHERTVGIVVFKEGYERGCHAYHLAGRHVYVVYIGAVNLGYIFAVTHEHAVVHKATVFVERFARLRHAVTVLFVGGHVFHVVGNFAVYHVAVCVEHLFHLAVRSFDKAVLVNAGVATERRYKTYVLTFGRFYGAHARVVRVVNVAHLETRAFAVESARSERGKLSFMRKLGYRVAFVHELRELTRAEELFYRACYGAYVYKALRRNLGFVLYLHSFAYNAL